MNRRLTTAMMALAVAWRLEDWLLMDDEAAVQAQAAIALYRITGEKVEQFPEGYNAE